MPKDTRLPSRPVDATNTGGLRRSYQSKIYGLFRQYNEKLQPRLERLLNRMGDQGFVKEFADKIDDTQGVTINAGAPKIIDEHITRSFKRGKQVAADNPRVKRQSIIIDSRLSRTDNLALQDLKTRNFGLIKNASDSMKNQLLVIMTDDIREGKSTAQIAQDIEDGIMDIGKNRSHMIARTEIAYSYNSAIAKTYQDAGIEQWQWLSAMGENTCEECSGRHGTIYEWDDEQPPIHPNCLTENTMYKSPSGFIAGLRADYNGPIMKFIFSDGRELTVTPNHLILTPQGFAAAKFLQIGDNILNSANFERITTRYPNDDREPSSVKDIFHSLLETSTSTPVTMPTSSENLHGDGIFSKGNIDIVWSDSFLKDKRNSKFLKMITKYNFTPADIHLFAFSGFSPLAQFGFGAAFATDGIMRFNRQSASFFRSRVPISNMLNFSERPMINIMFNQYPIYNTSTNIQLLRNLIQRYSTVVQTDNIIDIKVMSFHGKVYDFNTYNSLGIANSVITSNCLCTIYPIVKEGFKP